MTTQKITRMLTALLLAALILCLAGCQIGGGFAGETTTIIDSQTGGEKEVPLITIAIDSPVMPALFVSQFLETVPGNQQDFLVTVELINPLAMVTEGDDGKPAEDPKNYLARMRTEMMAGKGPDIFLCDCFSTAMWGAEEDPSVPAFEDLTFHYPEQAMKNNLFLPLDEYMEKAQFMERDKMNPTIMEAGRYDGKQMILPVKYQFDVYCFDPEASAPPAEELLPTGEFPSNIPRMAHTDLLSYFGQPADYSQDVPSFTEDELLELALAGMDSQNEAVVSGPVTQWLWPSTSYNDLPAYTMLPSYNREGGVTASVTCYAAINANTKYPEEAFLVLDRLLSQEVQQNAYITSSVSGVSVYDELGSYDTRYNSWWMNDANYQSFCAIREQINAVKFYTPLDREAMFTLSKAYLAEGASEDSVKTAVHKAYTTMKMMLAES